MPKLTPNREYCSIARALDVLGERWTLLIVRDLLSGPKRFGDLERLVVGITAKWLTARLRALEASGVVARDGRLYRLTPQGESLRPMMEELSLWASVHDARPPRPDETIIPAHDMWALEVFLNRVPSPVAEPLTWCVDLTDDGTHTFDFDGERWAWRSEAPDDGLGAADLVVRTSTRGWSTLLSHAQLGRTSPAGDYELTGSPPLVEQFRRLFDIA